MGRLDIYALRTPQFVRAGQPGDRPPEEDEDRHTLVYNLAQFTARADGHPEGWYTGELVLHGQWSYAGYNEVRALLSIAAFGVEPEAVWEDPVAFGDHPLADLVPLIHFADDEGAIGPVTAGKVAAALAEVPIDLLLPPLDVAYATRGRDTLLACMRDAHEHEGFALWR
jgi:hypothetical protein